jgi:hypothetical protein
VDEARGAVRRKAEEDLLQPQQHRLHAALVSRVWLVDRGELFVLSHEARGRRIQDGLVVAFVLDYNSNSLLSTHVRKRHGFSLSFLDPYWSTNHPSGSREARAREAEDLLDELGCVSQALLGWAVKFFTFTDRPT